MKITLCACLIIFAETVTSCNNSVDLAKNDPSPMRNLHHIDTFHFRNHSYIDFDSRSSSRSIAHDPECICLKRQSVQQNFHSFKYIDWPEEIEDIGQDQFNSTQLEAYANNDSIFVRYADPKQRTKYGNIYNRPQTPKIRLRVEYARSNFNSNIPRIAKLLQNTKAQQAY